MSLIPISEKVTSLFVLPYFFTEECSYAMLCFAMLELVELYLVIFQYYYLDGMGADINAMMGKESSLVKGYALTLLTYSSLFFQV